MWAWNFIDGNHLLRRDGKKIMLLMDGYWSKIACKKLFILKNDVVVAGHPDHTSHDLQHLEVWVFDTAEEKFCRLFEGTWSEADWARGEPCIEGRRGASETQNNPDESVSSDLSSGMYRGKAMLYICNFDHVVLMWHGPACIFPTLWHIQKHEELHGPHVSWFSTSPAIRKVLWTTYLDIL